ncbi:hypothetical protein L596_009470 [Steinernema carpocapsae]|uniref:Uncharacterized protein n=1 Tax=Steinernema carpocapsae TaxID=34508 RepID=A0A4U5PG87_STECR|nr:hypothetical protein L596_009470 [Steinernema carpocapsae]
MGMTSGKGSIKHIRSRELQGSKTSLQPEHITSDTFWPRAAQNRPLSSSLPLLHRDSEIPFGAETFLKTSLLATQIRLAAPRLHASRLLIKTPLNGRRRRRSAGGRRRLHKKEMGRGAVGEAGVFAFRELGTVESDPRKVIR